MRVEKRDNQINYWHAVDDGLPHPIVVGIEHENGRLSAIQMNNPNTGRLITLSGIELEAVATVFNESGVKIEQNKPDDGNVV